MAFFKGAIKLLYIKVSGTYIPVGCLTSNSLSEDTTMLPTTRSSSDGWQTARPVRQGANIEFEGVQVQTVGAGADTTKASYDKLKALKRARTKVEWKVEDTNFTFLDEGEGYITQIGEAAAIGEYLTFSGSIRVQGEPTFSVLDGDYIFQSGEGYLFQNGTAYLFN